VQPADALDHLDADARAVRAAVETVVDPDELRNVVGALLRRVAEAWPEDRSRARFLAETRGVSERKRASPRQHRGAGARF
jgi:hypothetical protein